MIMENLGEMIMAAAFLLVVVGVFVSFGESETSEEDAPGIT